MSSPPQVLSSTTTGSFEAACWAAATADSCPGLTQLLAFAKSATKKIGANAISSARSILLFTCLDLGIWRLLSGYLSPDT